MSGDQSEPLALDGLIDKFFQDLSEAKVINICTICFRPIITVCPDCEIDLANSGT